MAVINRLSIEKKPLGSAEAQWRVHPNDWSVKIGSAGYTITTPSLMMLGCELACHMVTTPSLMMSDSDLTYRTGRIHLAFSVESDRENLLFVADRLSTITVPLKAFLQSELAEERRFEGSPKGISDFLNLKGEKNSPFFKPILDLLALLYSNSKSEQKCYTLVIANY